MEAMRLCRMMTTMTRVLIPTRALGHVQQMASSKTSHRTLNTDNLWMLKHRKAITAAVQPSIKVATGMGSPCLLPIVPIRECSCPE